MFLVDSVGALDGRPDCTSAQIVGDSISNSYTVQLACGDLGVFVNSGSTSAWGVDLAGIGFLSNGEARHPFLANIDGDFITLYYYRLDGLPLTGLSIAGGVLKNDTLLNEDIQINSGAIQDLDLPYLFDDYYDIYDDTLAISGDSNILANDIDAEGLVIGAFVVSPPEHGNVDLLEDGSFTYTREEGYYEDDFFTYSAIDESGNIAWNEATVFISDVEPTINATMYTNSIYDSTKSKIGDTVCVDVESNEAVDLSDMIIAGVVIDDYRVVDAYNYSFCRIMTIDDEDGSVAFSVTATDMSGKNGYYSNDNGAIFDKTAPQINLNSDSFLEIGLNDDYDEMATAIDNIDDPIDVQVTGSVDTSRAGDYLLTYDAVDSSGNMATSITRTVRVVDYTTQEYVDYYQQVRQKGFYSNLDQANFDNVDSFSGLYIEPILNGHQSGRITFTAPLDLTDGDLLDFLLNFDQYVVIDKIGKLGINFKDLDDTFILRGLGARLSFYNLEKIGYGIKHSNEDVFKALTVSDDNGELLEKASLINNFGSYGCGAGVFGCVYEIDIAHFTFFEIKKRTIDLVDSITNPIIGGGNSFNNISVVDKADLGRFANSKSNIDGWLYDQNVHSKEPSDRGNDETKKTEKVKDVNNSETNSKIQSTCTSLFCMVSIPFLGLVGLILTLVILLFKKFFASS